jgi:hypothetical protein
MAKLTLTDIVSGFASSVAINANNALIEAALENTLSRDGTTPNAMEANLDMNSYDVNNVGALNASVVTIGGVSIVPSLTYTALAANITNVPAGSIAATNVQSAINELDTEKEPAITTLGVSKGGTGLATLPANRLLVGNGTSTPNSPTVGSSGQVLTSNGAGSDPSFQDVSAAPSVQLTANSGITVNEWVALRTADGQVEMNDGIAIPGASTEGTIVAGIGTVLCSVYDSTAGKTLTAYTTSAPETYLVVGTVSGGSLTYGTPVSLGLGVAVTDGAMAFDSTNGKIAFAYRSGGTTGYCVVCTISGTTVSAGTPVAYPASHDSLYTAAAYEPTQGRIFLQYTSGTTAYGLAGAISGTTITFGTAVSLDTTTPTYHSCCSIGSSTLACVYKKSTFGYIKIASLSGSTVSFGSATTIASGAGSGWSEVVYDTVNSIIVSLVYTSSAHSIATGTASGTTYTGLTSSTQSGTSATINPKWAYYDSVTESVMALTPSYAFSIYDISLTTPFYSTSNSEPKSVTTGLVFEPVARKWQYSGYNGSDIVGHQLGPFKGSTNYTNYLGMAGNTVLATETASVQLPGTVNTGQAGLTTNTIYYLDSFGGLTTLSTTGIIVGKALSSSNLLLTW